MKSNHIMNTIHAYKEYVLFKVILRFTKTADPLNVKGYVHIS